MAAGVVPTVKESRSRWKTERKSWPRGGSARTDRMTEEVQERSLKWRPKTHNAEYYSGGFAYLHVDLGRANTAFRPSPPLSARRLGLSVSGKPRRVIIRSIRPSRRLCVFPLSACRRRRVFSSRLSSRPGDIIRTQYYYVPTKLARFLPADIVREVRRFNETLRKLLHVRTD